MTVLQAPSARRAALGVLLCMAIGALGCSASMSIAGMGPSPKARDTAAKVSGLLREGRLRPAIDEARLAADAARAQPGDLASKALYLQMLGLALARADHTDEALRVAEELRAIPGSVSFMGVHAEVALSHCKFDAAAGFYLDLRAKTPGGANDVSTEGGLSAVDLAEGRTQRGRLWIAAQRNGSLASTYARTNAASAPGQPDSGRLRRGNRAGAARLRRAAPRPAELRSSTRGGRAARRAARRS